MDKDPPGGSTPVAVAATTTLASVPAAGTSPITPTKSPRWRTWFFQPPEGSPETLAPRVQATNFLAALFVLLLLLWLALTGVGYHWNWEPVARRWRLFVAGWTTTLALSVVSLVGATVVGTLFALAGRSRFLPLRYLSKIYVEVVRGTPFLVQILIAWYGVANAAGVNNRYLVGGVTLALFGGAYISEVVRAGIESIGKSQLESAKAIGLTPGQTYRYVIFPQALRLILPPLAVQFAGLIKDSSILSFIGVGEFAFDAKLVSDNTYSPLEAYLPLAAGYLLLTLPISHYTRKLEGRHRFET